MCCTSGVGLTNIDQSDLSFEMYFRMALSLMIGVILPFSGRLPPGCLRKTDPRYVQWKPGPLCAKVGIDMTEYASLL